MEASQRRPNCFQACGDCVRRLCEAGPRQDGLPSIDVSPCPRFEYDSGLWLEYLQEHGYAVVAGVLSLSEVEHAHDLLWKHLGEAGDWVRSEPDTWSNDSFDRMGMTCTGIMNKRGVGQSDVSWFCRTRPKVRGAFEQIWETNSVLTSFDGINVFRPWHHGLLERKTIGGWFHVDQGPTKRGRHCVQGFVSLTHQSARTGGLAVMPGSHRQHDELLRGVELEQDFIEVPESSPLFRRPRRLVQCSAGDLVLWDSRCCHCNEPAQLPPHCAKDELLRVCVYVSMTPKAWAGSHVLNDRRRAYGIKATTSHWPHTSVMGIGWGRGEKISFEDAPPERKDLIC